MEAILGWILYYILHSVGSCRLVDIMTFQSPFNTIKLSPNLRLIGVLPAAACIDVRPLQVKFVYEF